MGGFLWSLIRKYIRLVLRSKWIAEVVLLFVDIGLDSHSLSSLICMVCLIMFVISLSSLVYV